MKFTKRLFINLLLDSFIKFSYKNKIIITWTFKIKTLEREITRDR